MNEPRPESIVINGQWIEIAKAEETAPLHELIRLRDIAKLPFSQDKEISHPDTGTSLPIPFGNLVAYASQLANEWGGDDMYVRLLFHRKFDGSISQEEFLAQTSGIQMTEEELKQAIAEGKARYINQEGEISLPSDSSDNTQQSCS